jgi:hypothetical protein
VPLSKPDRDITLEVQPLIDETYQRFRYSRSIDYTNRLPFPLEASEARWLQKQLRARPGRR